MQTVPPKRLWTATRNSPRTLWSHRDRRPAAAAAAPDFCALWPKAKPVLQFLVGLIALLPIPGGGLAAGGILTGLIALGDQLYKQKCG